MPTYEYECSACGHRLEKFQSMSSAALKKCPECGKAKLVRLFGMGAGIIFKGSGFYETDYKRAGEKKDGQDAKEGKDAGAGKDGESGKEKPAEASAPAAKDAQAKAESAAKEKSPKTSGRRKAAAGAGKGK